MNFEPQMPLPGEKQPEQEKKVENMDKYEREKIESTVNDLEFTANVLKNVLICADFCDEKRIDLKRGKRPDFSTIMTYPGKSVAGPDSDFYKGISQLSGLFQKAQVDMARNIHFSHKNELENRIPKVTADASQKTKGTEDVNAIVNISEYEREKMECTIGYLEHTIGIMKNFLIMIDFCNEKGIEIPHSARQNFDNLRYPGEDAVAGPNSKLTKGLTELDNMAYAAQKAFSEVIPTEYRSELESRIIK